MFKNYLKVAFRHLSHYKGYTVLNVSSLVIGLTCGLFIFLYVQDELSYDRSHGKADRIYRVIQNSSTEQRSTFDASVPFPVGPTLRSENPALVLEAVRFFNFWAPSLNLTYTDEKQFNEKRLFFTDPSVFRVFDFPLIWGNADQALVNPNTIVLTQAMARKYFGTEEPIGKVLMFENQYPLTVTGVMQEVPRSAHFGFDFLVSVSTLDQVLNERQRTSWFWNPCWTYLLLPDASARSRQQLEKLLPALVSKHYPEVTRKHALLAVQALPDIHLHSNVSVEIEPNGDIRYIYLLAVIGLFILVIGCINFINLVTARTSRRAREVGIRKANGAHQSSLVKQFLFESTLTSMLALGIAALLVGLLLPFFNGFTGKHLEISSLSYGWLLPGVLGATLLIGLIAGSYPAFYLAAFRPEEALKNRFRPKGKAVFRRTLVVFQFVISVLLVVATTVVGRQLAHLRNARLGFDKEQVIMVPINRSALTDLNGYAAFKRQLLRNSRIRSVTATEQVLGVDYNSGLYKPEGITEPVLFSRMVVQHDFTETFRIPVVAGRSFSEKFPTDTSNAVLINQAMVKRLGWETPEKAIGKRFDVGQFESRVIGVVQDFRIASLHKPVEPFVLQLPRNQAASNFFIKYMAVRAEPGNPAAVIRSLEENWKKFVPDRAFEYFFLDHQLDAQYRMEERIANVVSVFTVVAILTACIGLLGLISFTAEQRTKEIGIRKVLGATTQTIMYLLVKEFVGLVLLANLIAVPLAYFLLNRWLAHFADRLTIGTGMFTGAVAVTLATALLTTGYHAFKAALQNPVRSLRSE